MFFTPHIDASQFARYSVSSNIGSQFSNHIHNIPALTHVPRISLQPSLAIPLLHQTLPCIDPGKMLVSLNALRPETMVPESVITFKQSVLDHQLHSYGKDQCIKDVNSSPGYNNQLQCGVPDAIRGLMVQDPNATKCVLDLQKAKYDHLVRCNKIQ